MEGSKTQSEIVQVALDSFDRQRIIQEAATGVVRLTPKELAAVRSKRRKLAATREKNDKIRRAKGLGVAAATGEIAHDSTSCRACDIGTDESGNETII